MAGILMERATAVVIRNDRVLLLEDQTFEAYMMPGSLIEPNENRSDTVTRGLFEQTGLSAVSTAHLFDWESTTNRHSVFRIEAGGDVQIGNGPASFIWWDRKQGPQLFAHVNAILLRLAAYE